MNWNAKRHRRRCFWVVCSQDRGSHGFTSILPGASPLNPIFCRIRHIDLGNEKRILLLTAQMSACSHILTVVRSCRNRDILLRSNISCARTTTRRRQCILFGLFFLKLLHDHISGQLLVICESKSVKSLQPSTSEGGGRTHEAHHSL